jgi:hypothetical protein
MCSDSGLAEIGLVDKPGFPITVVTGRSRLQTERVCMCGSGLWRSPKRYDERRRREHRQRGRSSRLPLLGLLAEDAGTWHVRRNGNRDDMSSAACRFG